MGWWNNINLEVDMDSNPDWWFIRSVYKEACQGKTIFSHTATGYVKTEKDLKKIENEIFKSGAHLAISMLGSRHDDGDAGRKYYSWDDGVIEICPFYGRDNGFTISIVSTNEAKALTLRKRIFKFLRQKAPTGRIKMLASSPEGMSLIDIGTVDQKIISDNYSPEIQDAYNFIRDDLITKDPSGRIILLDGEPGTGKSYFIRGLVSEVEAWYIYVPAALVGQLSGPNLVKALAGKDEDSKLLPTVLIVEDADSILVKRKTGDPNKLAELLNMSDGIFGDLSDIRILASTNAKRMEIDEAILRPGRLSRHIHFDKIPMDQANKIYKRLTGKELVLNATKDKPFALAEIYMLARDDGWKPPKIQDGGYTGGNFL